MAMTQVHLICGKVGAGKTTYARRVADERNALLLTLDEWLLHFYEEPMSREAFDARVALCIEMMMRIAERLVVLNTETVLDCGFWRRSVRDDVRSRVRGAGGQVVLYYVELPADERWKRIESRNGALDASTHHIDRAMFEMFEGWFDEPSSDEAPVHVA